MSAPDVYKTIVEALSFKLKEKRSEFIAYAMPVKTMEEAKEAIEKISKQNINATHNCWAYRVGFPDLQEHFSDDGEPSGTAGRPILAAITKEDLHDVAVVVTRYFGGVKLGVRGLIDAYGDTAQKALEQAKTKYIQLTRKLNLTTTYDSQQTLIHSLKKLGLDESLWQIDYLDKVYVSINVPLSLEVPVREKLNSYDITQLFATPPVWSDQIHQMDKATEQK